MGKDVAVTGICSICYRKLKVRERSLGKQIKCPKCYSSAVILTQETASQVQQQAALASAKKPDAVHIPPMSTPWKVVSWILPLVGIPTAVYFLYLPVMSSLYGITESTPAVKQYQAKASAIESEMEAELEELGEFRGDAHGCYLCAKEHSRYRQPVKWQEYDGHNGKIVKFGFCAECTPPGRVYPQGGSQVRSPEYEAYLKKENAIRNKSKVRLAALRTGSEVTPLHGSPFAWLLFILGGLIWTALALVAILLLVVIVPGIHGAVKGTEPSSDSVSPAQTS